MMLAGRGSRVAGGHETPDAAVPESGGAVPARGEPKISKANKRR